MNKLEYLERRMLIVETFISNSLNILANSASTADMDYLYQLNKMYAEEVNGLVTKYEEGKKEDG